MHHHTQLESSFTNTCIINVLVNHLKNKCTEVQNPRYKDVTSLYTQHKQTHALNLL